MSSPRSCLRVFCLGGRRKSIRRLSHALTTLSPNVDPAEAEAVARTAHVTARELAREYPIVGPPLFQNFLIHIGIRQRGYASYGRTTSVCN
ncbi:MAG TPA: hypothetical protein VGI85_15040 [Chthoniobacterales bacterium]